jgi:hypothetical protein
LDSSTVLGGVSGEMAEDGGLADETELSPEFVPWRGNVTPTPSPLPVREAPVYQQSNE